MELLDSASKIEYDYYTIIKETETNMNNTVIKTVEILKLISANEDGMTLSQIVKDLALPKTTVFNILHTLVAMDMLSMVDGPIPVYRLGIESLKVGLSYLNSNSLDSAARPILSRLSLETNETTFMSVRSGEANAIYVMKCMSGSDYQTVYSVGAVRNMLSIAMGKAMLATMSDEEVRSIIQPEMFLVCNLASIYDMDTLLDFLHKTRELGYVVDATSENPMFASSAAAPIRNLDGELVAAISIVIMHDPTNMARVHELGKKTAAAALEISRALGFTGESVL